MARTKQLEEDEPLSVARGVLDQIIAKHDPEEAREKGKDPVKVAAGLRGGAKGGKARAKKLSARKRSEIARNPVKTRWKKSSA
jgi:hypothetical protein